MAPDGFAPQMPITFTERRPEMKYRWEEIELLIDLLEAEVQGRPIDRAEASRLAAKLAQLCPEIAGTMGRVNSRMLSPGQGGLAA